MTHSKARNWAATLGITTAIALTGCGISPNASAPADNTSVTVQNAAAAGPAEPAPSAPKAGHSNKGGKAQKAEALTQTYTSPDGKYMLNYPASWTVSTDKGYLELTSPDGSVTGHVSPKSLNGPDADWMGRHVTQYRSNPAVVMSEIVGDHVATYSGYNSAANPAQDTMGWGLSQVNASGLVSMAAADSDDELWAYFEQAGVNKSGKALNDKKAAQVAQKAVRSKNGATVEAILQSVQLVEDLSGETPPGGNPEVLDQTYTSPDGAFTMSYPSTWTVKTDQGYLEVTSRTGQTVGRIATTDVRPLPDDWFTSPRYMMAGEDTPLTERLGSRVSTYSAYRRNADTPDEDSILFGLTQVNSSGLVAFGEGNQWRELWAEFTYEPINTTGRHLTDDEVSTTLTGHVNTHQDVPAVQAMLQSIRIN